jgi:hypothetical protein
VPVLVIYRGQDGNLKKEPWDSSSEKAKTLRLDDFGIFYQVQEIAKPKRTAANRKEAAIILKKIAKEGTLTNKTGMSVH